MTTDELYVQLTASGYRCRVKGDEVVLETCIFCGNDRWNLEINPVNGLANCWVCKGTGGRADRVISQLTGQVHHIQVESHRPKKSVIAPPPDALDFLTKAVADVPSALHYLTRRGITSDVAAGYGLRVCIQPKHLLEGRIVIPARDFWTGTTLGWIGRSYTGVRPKYMSTIGRKVIFGWRQRVRSAPVVVVEGAFDGISVHRAGYHAAVLGGTGGAGVLELASRLPGEVLVVVMLDGDAAVQATQLYWQAKRVREHVGWISLPTGTDPADLDTDQVREYVERTQ